MRAILLQKRKEIRADMKKLPQYCDMGPDTDEMSGGQREWYTMARGQLKLIAEILGDECWHETEILEGGFHRCVKCGGYWRHRPCDTQAEELTREQVIAEVTSRI